MADHAAFQVLRGSSNAKNRNADRRHAKEALWPAPDVRKLRGRSVGVRAKSHEYVQPSSEDRYLDIDGAFANRVAFHDPRMGLKHKRSQSTGVEQRVRFEGLDGYPMQEQQDECLPGSHRHVQHPYYLTFHPQTFNPPILYSNVLPPGPPYHHYLPVSHDYVNPVLTYSTRDIRKLLPAVRRQFYPRHQSSGCRPQKSKSSDHGGHVNPWQNVADLVERQALDSQCQDASLLNREEEDCASKVKKRHSPPFRSPKVSTKKTVFSTLDRHQQHTFHNTSDSPNQYTRVSTLGASMGSVILPESTCDDSIISDHFTSSTVRGRDAGHNQYIQQNSEEAETPTFPSAPKVEFDQRSLYPSSQDRSNAVRSSDNRTSNPSDGHVNAFNLVTKQASGNDDGDAGSGKPLSRDQTRNITNGNHSTMNSWPDSKTSQKRLKPVDKSDGGGGLASPFETPSVLGNKAYLRHPKKPSSLSLHDNSNGPIDGLHSSNSIAQPTNAPRTTYFLSEGSTQSTPGSKSALPNGANQFPLTTDKKQRAIPLGKRQRPCSSERSSPSLEQVLRKAQKSHHANSMGCSIPQPQPLSTIKVDKENSEATRTLDSDPEPLFVSNPVSERSTFLPTATKGVASLSTDPVLNRRTVRGGSAATRSIPKVQSTSPHRQNVAAGSSPGSAGCGTGTSNVDDGCKTAESTEGLQQCSQTLLNFERQGIPLEMSSFLENQRWDYSYGSSSASSSSPDLDQPLHPEQSSSMVLETPTAMDVYVEDNEITESEQRSKPEMLPIDNKQGNHSESDLIINNVQRRTEVIDLTSSSFKNDSIHSGRGAERLRSSPKNCAIQTSRALSKHELAQEPVSGHEKHMNGSQTTNKGAEGLVRKEASEVVPMPSTPMRSNPRAMSSLIGATPSNMFQHTDKYNELKNVEGSGKKNRPGRPRKASEPTTFARPAKALPDPEVEVARANLKKKREEVRAKKKESEKQAQLVKIERQRERLEERCRNVEMSQRKREARESGSHTQQAQVQGKMADARDMSQKAALSNNMEEDAKDISITQKTKEAISNMAYAKKPSNAHSKPAPKPRPRQRQPTQSATNKTVSSDAKAGNAEGEKAKSQQKPPKYKPIPEEKLTASDLILIKLREQGHSWKEVTTQMRQRIGDQNAQDTIRQRHTNLHRTMNEICMPGQQDLLVAPLPEVAVRLKEATTDKKERAISPDEVIELDDFGNEISHTFPSARCDRCCGRNLDHPTTGGKTLTQSAWNSFYEDLELSESPDDETELCDSIMHYNLRNESPMTTADCEHFLYTPMIKTAPLQASLDDANAVAISQSTSDLGNANKAAGDAFTNQQSSFRFSSFNCCYDNGMAVWTGVIQEEGKKVQVAVVRSLMKGNERNFPRTKQGWMNTRIYIIKEQTTFYEDIRAYLENGGHYKVSESAAPIANMEEHTIPKADDGWGDVGDDDLESLFEAEDNDVHVSKPSHAAEKRLPTTSQPRARSNSNSSTYSGSSSSSSSSSPAAAQSASKRLPGREATTSNTVSFRPQILSSNCRITAQSTQPLNNCIYTVRDMANREAATQWWAHRARSLGKVASEKEKRDASNWCDTLEQDEAAFDETVAGKGEEGKYEVRIWVEEGKVVGPRNV